MIRRWLFSAALLFLINMSAAISTEARADDRIRVFVSILPQKYFVERIGGEHVEVSVMAPPGANPHTYEPKPRQMVELTRAKIYFAVGVTFESVWLDKIASANPEMWIIHTDAGIEKIAMTSHHGHGEHAEGQDPGHQDQARHETADPHIWTSPPLVKIMAGTIKNALSERDPAREPVYEANFKAFAAEIDGIDREFKALFPPGGKTVSFMVFHPSWGYFAQAYGLNQIPVEVEGKDPKPAQLQELIEEARSRGIKMIFVQPQFSTRTADIVAHAIGGQIVVADPLAYDWADNLRRQAKQIKAALK